MTSGELLVDLNDRLDRGISHLANLIAESNFEAVTQRLAGKQEGLKLVKDWLRSYSMEQIS